MTYRKNSISKKELTIAGRGHFELQSFPRTSESSHTSPWPTAILMDAHMNQMVIADAGLVIQDLPRAPWPQAILKLHPPNRLDYRVHYKP